MPRFTITHSRLARIANALLADIVHRHQLATDNPRDWIMHAATAEENYEALRQINRARTKDGHAPISGGQGALWWAKEDAPPPRRKTRWRD
jgi:hypothetical protein